MTDHIAFVDIETTGLDLNRDRILEVGVKIVQRDFTVLDTFERVIRTSWSDVKRLASDTVWSMHEKSGLLGDLQDKYRSEEDYNVWRQTVAFLDKWYKGFVPVIAGTGVDFDRRMLDSKGIGITVLGTKLLDISSYRRTAEFFYGIPKPPALRNLHRVIPDIDDAIDQLKAITESFENRGRDRGYAAGVEDGKRLKNES